MTKRVKNSKRLHIHAVPVVLVLLALTFLVGGTYVVTNGGAYGHQLGRALFRKGANLTPTSSGGVHFGLARATPPPQPAAAPPVNADAQVGASATLQQTLDQTVNDSSY